MKNQFTTSYNILSGSLRPWLPENQDNEKFIHLLSTKIRSCKDDPQSFFKELGKAYTNLNISIEEKVLLEFSELATIQPNPDFLNINRSIDRSDYFNKQTEFYTYLIKNEYFSILNGIYTDILPLDEDDAKYKLYHIAKQIEELITHTVNVSDHDKSTNYIIDLLKLHLFNIYFELQRLFPDIIDFEVLSQNEVLHLISPDYEKERANPKSLAFYLDKYLQNIESKSVSAQPTTHAQEKEKEKKKDKDKPVFNVKKEDFRPGYRGKLSYDDILKKDKFALLEKHLFEYEFIDQDYNFTNKHERKKHLAAIIRLLISKDYFQKKNFKSRRKEFEPAKYRQYLDHRYNVNTSQQFSRIKSEDIEHIKTKYYWLNKI